jgi:large subunit ribosomal protein L9
MRVILNQDVPNLGELGDVKDVAAGYARNFLFPRSLAFAHNAKTVALFEKRKVEIEDLKAKKRSASAGLREKIEAEELSVTVPAGANGKLYGAVNSHTIADELAKRGVEIERKKIEILGHSIKSVGTYKVLIHLYEKEEATLKLVIVGQAVKAETPREESQRPRRRRYEESERSEAPAGAEAPAREAPEA